jgi:hypothetical protein
LRPVIASGIFFGCDRPKLAVLGLIVDGPGSVFTTR